jgi:enediyne biosynthesis protein E4
MSFVHNRTYSFNPTFPVVLGAAVLMAACSESRSSEPSATGEVEDAFFTPVTEQAGLGGFRHIHGGFGEKWFPEIMGSGGGFIDYDGDGWLDVLLVGGGSLPGRPQEEIPALVLYRNMGDGTFSNYTEQAGLGGVRAYGFGIAAADYDNDGDEDFLLTTLQENMLFRNDGGVFQEVGRESGITGISRFSTAAMFFDADRDGHLDLYVANYVDWTPENNIHCMFSEGIRDYCNPRDYDGVAGTFYRNNGDGTFTNRTEEAGFLNGIEPAESKSLGVGELDFNHDGWPDVYVTNDGQRNFLFVSNGDGTFSEAALPSGVALDQNGTPRAGMGIDTGVVDSTGETTIFVGNFSGEMTSVWRHDGNGLFTDRSTVSQIGFPTLGTLTFGLILFDVDLDTDLDLLQANGHVLEQIASLEQGVTLREPAQLFLNRGNGVFDEVKHQSGPLATLMLARGLASGDFDRDGDLDVLFTENSGPVHLWRNDMADGRYLRVKLQGTESNRDGIGTRVRATVDGLTMERRVRTGSSYLSQSEKTVAFGLGDMQEVALLEVRWPSGLVERFEQVAAGQEVLLVEGSGELVPVPPPAQAVAAR